MPLVVIMQNIYQTASELIDSQKTAFISSVDDDGFPNMKAMLAPRNREGIKTFYFTTNTSSIRVAQYRKNPKACVYFCNQGIFRGVMFKGNVDILEDIFHKTMIWRDGDTLYYPQGVTDPYYCVLRFTAASGRYFSNLQSGNFLIE